MVARSQHPPLHKYENTHEKLMVSNVHLLHNDEYHKLLSKKHFLFPDTIITLACNGEW